MTETEFSLADIQVDYSAIVCGIQGDGGVIFDAQTVERMEYLILGALKWRMRSISPFPFISFFISLLKLKEDSVSRAIKDRAVELVFKAQIDTKLLEFKPSIIAASALLSACHKLFPLQFPRFRNVISSCSCVTKENMIKCYNSMQEIDMVSSSNTPANVLDRPVSSSGSEISTAGTTTVTSITQRDIKRRKINDYGTIIKCSTSLRSKSKALFPGPL